MESLTVTELNETIKNALYAEFKNRSLTVVGEISNVKGSGKHTFLTLKDDNTSVSVAFWGTRLDNEHGDHVEITGRLDYYTKTSNINFIGSGIKMIGIGSLHTQYEELREKYEKQGFFNNKKPLPEVVKNVGIITSQGGAALHDFLYVLEKNGFAGTIYVYNCIVQGSKCPSSVAAGIKFFNSPFFASAPKKCSDSESNIGSDSESNNDSENDSDNDSDLSGDSTGSNDPFAIVKDGEVVHSGKKIKKRNKSTYDDDDIEVEVDLVVITRGGGSFEDLMGFSHPKVIEAINGSKKYTISAVGHEVDSMLSDAVSNYRAPTPSVAGEVVASININKKKKLDDIENDLQRIKNEMLQSLYKYRNNVTRIRDNIEDPRKILDSKLDKIHENAKSHIRGLIHGYSRKISEIRDILSSNNPDHMLEQGFIVLTDRSGNIIHDINNILDQKLKLIHITGSYDVSVKTHKKAKSKKKS